MSIQDTRDGRLRPMKNTAVGLVALLLWAGLGPACRTKSEGNDVTDASGKDPARVIYCLGRILPGEKVRALAAPPQAIVKELLVNRGERVTRGQILAVFMSSDAAEAVVRLAEADLRTAEVRLTRAQGPEKLSEIEAQEAVLVRTNREYEKARIDLERAAGLRGADLIPPSEYEDAEIAFKRAESVRAEADKRLAALRASRPMDIVLAERELVAARAAVDRARAEAELCFLKAPVDGIVIDISAWPGEAVGEGGLLDLGETDRMMVEAEVYINDIAAVRLGDPALIRGDGFPGDLGGRVVEIIGRVGENVLYPTDPYSFADRRVVKVRIRLDDGTAVAALNNAQVSVQIGS